jgi:hypothetical protein
MSPRRLTVLVGLALVICWTPNPRVQGQQQNQGGQNQNQNSTTAIAGIAVDADGVLKMHTVVDRGGVLTKGRIEAARKTHDAAIWKTSELRKISLNRLEAAVQARLAAGEKPTEEMRYLVGLTRIKYVFFLPDTNDIVIAGPAEPWADDLSGRSRGIETGRPVVLLEDLIVALRAFGPQQRNSAVITCSIDPTREGLANMQEFLRRIGRVNPNISEQGIVRGLRESLGFQTITITGISANTHFAQVLVEADYRMKLIGIGLERPRTKIPSYVELANPRAVSQNALQRWYFVPNYECVRVSEDGNAMELVGDGVKLIGENEFVAGDGTRVDTKSANPAAKKYVDTFTAKYPELAAEVPVYAQLRNLIDISVAAAFIQREDYYGKAGWNMSTFGDEAKVPVETASAPKRVESAVASYRKGNTLMTPIGGGVQMEPKLALASEHLLKDEQGTVQQAHLKTKSAKLADGQWWWD